MRPRFVAAVIAAASLAVGCSDALRSKFPTEDEVRGRLHKGMSAEQVLATFGEPPGHQWVDVKLGGKVHYLAPAGARTKNEEGYAGFTIYFDSGQVWDWELIVMNPSYEHRLLASTTARSVLGATALILTAAVAYLALRRRRLRERDRKELVDAYLASTVPTAELPPEFQFITRETTLQTVTDVAGPHSRAHTFEMIADAGQPAAPIEAFEYELPQDGAVIVMPEHPFQSGSRIRAVVYRRPRGEI